MFFWAEKVTNLFSLLSPRDSGNRATVAVSGGGASLASLMQLCTQKASQRAVQQTQKSDEWCKRCLQAGSLAGQVGLSKAWERPCSTGLLQLGTQGLVSPVAARDTLLLIRLLGMDACSSLCSPS